MVVGGGVVWLACWLAGWLTLFLHTGGVEGRRGGPSSIDKLIPLLEYLLVMCGHPPPSLNEKLPEHFCLCFFFSFFLSLFLRKIRFPLGRSVGRLVKASFGLCLRHNNISFTYFPAVDVGLAP